MRKMHIYHLHENKIPMYFLPLVLDLLWWAMSLPYKEKICFVHDISEWWSLSLQSQTWIVAIQFICPLAPYGYLLQFPSACLLLAISVCMPLGHSVRPSFSALWCTFPCLSNSVLFVGNHFYAMCGISNWHLSFFITYCHIYSVLSIKSV